MKKLFKSYRYISELIGKKPCSWKFAFILNSFQNLFANVLIGYSLQMIIDGIYSNQNRLLTKGLIVLCLGAIYLIIGLPLFCYYLDSNNAKMKMILETKLFDKILRRDYESSLSTNYSNVVSVLQNDVVEAVGLFGWGFVVFFQAVLSGVGCLAIMIRVNIWLAMVVVLLSVALIFLNRLFSELLYKYAEEIRMLMQKRMELLNDILDNSIVLKIYSMMNTQCQVLSLLSQEKASSESSMRRKMNLKAVLESIVSDIIMMTVVVLFGSVLVSKKEISMGELLLAIELKNGIVFFFGYIGGYVNNLQSAIVSSEKIASFIESVEENVSAGAVSNQVMSIEFKNVSYQYPGVSKNVFSNLSFGTKTKRICFVGENGKGKSTIIKIIAGYLKNYTGEILINSENIDDFDMNKMVSIVPQDPIIINDTILNNVLFGSAKGKEIAVEATKKAGIYDEIMSMEKGFESILLEDGANISAGQRKRISIARALVVDTPILILDEFSANIDDATISQIIENLFSYIGDKMIIAITHDKKVASKFAEVISL